MCPRWLELYAHHHLRPFQPSQLNSIPIVAFDGVLSSDIIIINIVVVIIIIAHDNDKNLIKTLPCRLSGWLRGCDAAVMPLWHQVSSYMNFDEVLRMLLCVSICGTIELPAMQSRWSGMFDKSGWSPSFQMILLGICRQSDFIKNFHFHINGIYIETCFVSILPLEFFSFKFEVAGRSIFSELRRYINWIKKNSVKIFETGRFLMPQNMLVKVQVNQH